MFEGVTRSHRELHDRAARLGAALAAGGVQPGDRVALLLHNGFEFPESLLACHRIGACAVPINFRLTADEIVYILADARASALIAGERPDGLPRLPLEIAAGPEFEAAIAARPRAGGRRPRARRRVALLHVGHDRTTARPKGAVLTHANLVAATLSWIHEMGAGSPGSRCSTSGASTGCSRSSARGHEHRAADVRVRSGGRDPPDRAARGHHEGHDREWRRERVPSGGRACAARASGGGRRGSDRRPASALGRDAGRDRRAGHGPGARACELVAHCRRRLAGYKKPSAFHFVDRLPRNAAGKVAKRELRTRYGVSHLN